MVLTTGSVADPAEPVVVPPTSPGGRMKVRMLADVSGTRDGEAWPARGEIVDFSDDEAADLIKAGIAVAHKAEPPVESAAVDTEPAKRGPGRPRKAAESAERDED